MSQIEILRFLESQEVRGSNGVTAKEIAENVDVSYSSVITNLKNMRKFNIVEMKLNRGMKGRKGYLYSVKIKDKVEIKK